MNRQPLIGIAGRARAGKDTVAKALEPLGYKRVGFADALKEYALRVDPIINYDQHPDASVDLVRLSEAVQRWGWETCKDGIPEVRRLLQRLGTELREFDRTIWTDHAMRYRIQPLLADGYGVAVPDVRFPNEVDAIRNAGGIVVQVVRPGLPEDDHVSENALVGVHFDEVILNDGTTDDLAEKLIAGLHERRHHPTPLREVHRWG